MCGIASYVGDKPAYPIILNLLKRLEYRGYDSAGIALYDGVRLSLDKEAGPIERLEKSLEQQEPKGSIGLGHTRWATHGPATKLNAHPHHSQDEELTIVHNGTVLNYYKLKEALQAQNISFYGETDTEVLVNYFRHQQAQDQSDLQEVIFNYASALEGRSAFVLHDRQQAEKLYACNLGGELFLARSKDNELMICSDRNALAGYAHEAAPIALGQMAVIGKNGLCKLFNLTTRQEEIIPWETLHTSADSLEKGAYPHFMLKEIFEQEKVIAETISRFSANKGETLIAALQPWQTKIKKLRKIVIIACGTSWHAGLVARYFFQELAGLPTYCEYASEFLAGNVGPDDLIIAISQSGSTADTLQATQAAKDAGATVLSICNVANSALTRLSDAHFLTAAGPEIGVASTKAFTTQLAVLFLLASQCGQWRKKITAQEKQVLWQELTALPLKIKEILLNSPLIESLALKYQDAPNFLYLGRGQNFPIALEGALKLKEVSYINAEGLSAGEMKHGSIALIDDKLPCFFIAVKDEQYDKVINNLLEIRARQGQIIAITSGDDPVVRERVDETIIIPECRPIFYPFLTVIPTQLFAYYVARGRGTNIDKPRNLAKSVTVE